MKILIDDFMQNSDAPAQLISPALSDDYEFQEETIVLESAKSIDCAGIGYTDATNIVLDAGGVDENYSTGDQENLNNPTTNFSVPRTETNFVPFKYELAGIYGQIYQCFLVGEDSGQPTLPPVWGTIDGQNQAANFSSTAGGEVQNGILYFQPLKDSSFNEENATVDYSLLVTVNGNDPNLTFAAASNNGLKTFKLRTGEGFFYYYYDQLAWQTAIGTGNCKFLITRSGAVYKDSISDANLITNPNGTIGAAGGGSALPTGKIYAEINYSENGLYLFNEVQVSTFRITHDGSYIGRFAVGKCRDIPTTPDKEVGIYSTEQNRTTLSGQVIIGAGGYSGKSISVDTRYKIDAEIMADFYSAFPAQLSKGFPIFIYFDCESFKLPFDRLYGQLEKPDIVFQNSINRFLYSKRFNFKERF